MFARQTLPTPTTARRPSLAARRAARCASSLPPPPCSRRCRLLPPVDLARGTPTPPSRAYRRFHRLRAKGEASQALARVLDAGRSTTDRPHAASATTPCSAERAVPRGGSRGWSLYGLVGIVRGDKAGMHRQHPADASRWVSFMTPDGLDLHATTASALGANGRPPTRARPEWRLDTMPRSRSTAVPSDHRALNARSRAAEPKFIGDGRLVCGSISQPRLRPPRCRPRTPLTGRPARLPPAEEIAQLAGTVGRRASKPRRYSVERPLADTTAHTECNLPAGRATSELVAIEAAAVLRPR